MTTSVIKKEKQEYLTAGKRNGSVVQFDDFHDNCINRVMTVETTEICSDKKRIKIVASDGIYSDLSIESVS
jgi:hypothetical protein